MYLKARKLRNNHFPSLGAKLVHWISVNYNAEDADPETGVIVIPVKQYDEFFGFIYTIPGMEWLAEEIGHNTEIWVICNIDFDMEVIEWSIQGNYHNIEFPDELL